MISGICGLISYSTNTVNHDLFEKMVDRFGGGRLAIVIKDWFAIAKKSTDDEPLILSEDNIIVCFDGKLNNRKALMQSLNLKNEGFDCKLILEAYRKWGINFLGQIHGTFNLLVINETLEQIILATDHLSLRPLFYQGSEKKFMFGSDIRQVIDGDDLSPAISRTKVLEFLSPIAVIDEGITSPEASFFRRIKQLTYATCLLISRTGYIEQINYWKPPCSLYRNLISSDEFSREFKKIFYNVMEDYIEGQQIIGADLSGGIDSASVVFAIEDILRQQDERNRSFHTYTVSYNFSASQQDIKKIISAIQDYPNIQWHHIDADNLCGPLEFGKFHKYRSIAHPCTMNIPESYVQIAKMAKADGCRFLLSGHGADYYLEGTDVIWDSAIRSFKWKLLSNSIQLLRNRSSPGMLATYFFRYAVLPLLPPKISIRAYLQEYYEYTLKGFYPDLFTARFSREMTLLLQQQCSILFRKERFECWAQRLEHELLFPPNHLEDTIPVDIEIYHPFFDRRLLEFGLRVPPEFKFEYSINNYSHYGCRKVLQRKGLKDIIPAEIIGSQVKATYGYPMLRRLDTYLPIVFAKSQDCLVAEFQIVNMDKINEWLEKIPFASNSDNLYPVTSWLNAILNLELWLRATVDEFPLVKLSD